MTPCMRQVLDPALSSVDNEGFFSRFLYGLKRMQKLAKPFISSLRIEQKA